MKPVSRSTLARASNPGDVIPPAVDITDSATGIRVQAAAGVLPEGVKLVVREITDGAEYQRAGTALESIGKKFKLYDVCVTDKDGNEIQPTASPAVKRFLEYLNFRHQSEQE